MRRIATIGQVCKVITGKLDANAANENGAFPFFTCSVNPLRINHYAYDLECVLIAGNGDLNVKYFNGKFNAYQRTYIVSLKDEESDISVRYLYAFFLLYVEVLRKRSVGSTIKYIRLADITDAVISIPPLTEQQRIVDVLDQEFERIEALKINAEKSLHAAKDLFQAVLRKELEPKEGWITHELGVIADFKNGLNFGKEEGKFCYRFLGVGDFKDNLYVEVNNLGQIYKDEIDEDYLLQENDVVFVRSNGSKQLIGRCLLVKNVIEPAVFSGFCIRCRLKEKALLPQFLIHHCTMEETKTYLTSSGGGCNISNLNQKVLSSLKISAPQSITEQERIVSIIETHKKNCNTLLDNYQKTLSLCEDLKQSLLRKAFNGELN